MSQSSKLERLVISKMPVGALKPNDYNPNRQNEDDFDLLIRSIEEDGFTQPIVALKDGTIVDGEHRWRAACKMGMREVPVVIVPMTAAQARVATLRHNRARGSEDFGLTADVMRDLQRLGAIEWAQDSLQLDDNELNMMLQEASATAIEAIGAKAPAFSKAWNPETHAVSSEAAAQDGAVSLVLASPKTTQAIEARRERIDSAKTADERLEATSSLKLFRLSLRYKGEDAAQVRNALIGDGKVDPGIRLVEIAKKYNEYRKANGLS